MKRLDWVLACTVLVAGVARAADAPMLSGIDLQYIDSNVRAQDDFYRHVNGKWLDSVQIPADKARYGSFDMLRDDSQDQLRTIVEALQLGTVDVWVPKSAKRTNVLSAVLPRSLSEGMARAIKAAAAAASSAPL